MVSLYDQRSNIQWTTGLKTVEEMKQDPILKKFFIEPIILYYNRKNEVYKFDFLNELLGTYNIDSALPPEEAFIKLRAYMDILQYPTAEENNKAILELSNNEDKIETSKDIISFYANGNHTAYIPNATTVGAMWVGLVALGKKTINDVPEQYKDEVIYRLENNIFN